MFELGKDEIASFKQLFIVLSDDSFAFKNYTTSITEDEYVREWGQTFKRLYENERDQLAIYRRRMDEWDDNREGKDQQIENFSERIVNNLKNASFDIKDCEREFSTDTIRHFVDFFCYFFRNSRLWNNGSLYSYRR